MRVSINDLLFRLSSAAAHLRHGQSRYYIHSPFVFELVTNVLRKPLDRGDAALIQRFREHQMANRALVSVPPVGTSQQTEPKTFTVSQLAKRYSLTMKYGTLLAKLMRAFKPNSILETGTGTGFSAACMAIGNPGAAIHTIDAVHALVTAAKQSFEKHNIANVTCHQGLLDDVLFNVCKSISPIDAVFLDANHTLDATIRYFNIVEPYLVTKAFVIVDDIHWSKGMNNAWHALCRHPRVTLSLDFYRLGVLFLNPDFSCQTVRLYY